MHTAEFWIEHLNLQEHPEGGYYLQTYRSSETIGKTSLPSRFGGDRTFSTAIYFLLRSHDKSLFHRIKSDEIWHFYEGSPLTLYVLNEDGISLHKLGDHPERGESLQLVIPANAWFGATVDEPSRYTLSGCTVAPGFDFADFELANRKILTAQFSEYEKIIELLTLPDSMS